MKKKINKVFISKITLVAVYNVVLNLMLMGKIQKSTMLIFISVLLLVIGIAYLDHFVYGKFIFYSNGKYPEVARKTYVFFTLLFIGLLSLSLFIPFPMFNAVNFLPNFHYFWILGIVMIPSYVYERYLFSKVKE